MKILRATAPCELIPDPEWPHRNAKGRPLATLENLQYLLVHYGIEVAIDDRTDSGDAIAVIPGLKKPSFEHRRVMGEGYVTSLANMNGFKISIDTVWRYLTLIAIAEEAA
ncbi:hypothetical protein [Modicisalibacter xianhensis]|uniref:Uncharacterized protein n=1 Tax=Modicisalibacter xianhensis TaxID=442341 RepID=A0A1I3GBP4_9GAMM|nr:hypothetical protein [Halomonas xianhensis]SFI20873.1 hypothetical protein SAMN04487959_12920 [Halomonas xianhensis]